MADDSEVQVDVRNIGGIDETSVSFPAGVTVLTGRNATNRTSFLQAIMAACGSDHATLKGDADEGHVTLSIDDETYTRTLSRSGGTVTLGGDPYLDDATEADLFAFLLESNDARRTVRYDGDLRDVIMEPVDTERIRAEIEQVEAEKRDLEQTLTDLEGLQERLPELTRERTHLADLIEEKHEDLAATEAEIEALDTEVEETREEKAAIEEHLDTLRETRSDLQDVRYNLETQRDRLAVLREDRAAAEADLADLPATPAGEMREIEAEIDRLRRRKQDLEADVSELQNVIQFNEERLADPGDGLVEAVESGERESVTDQLLTPDAVVCWTCGSEVDRKQIEKTVDRLRELSERKLGDIRSLEADLEERRSRKRGLERQQREREQLERTVAQTDGEIDDATDRIQRLEDREADLLDRIASLETTIEDLQQTDHEDVLDLHKQANQLEFEIERLEGELDDVEVEIARVERRLARRDDLEAEREAVQSRLTELRTRIESLEADAVAEFNDHMNAVLDLLAYENLERIWIERTEAEVRQGRRTVTKGEFDLHVVRSTESGAAYEDTISHLSESEQEVTGLIFALAGYLTHDVHEQVPFMLLDSLEAIDAERIATLVDYFADFADIPVVALLPEDAAALDESYQRVTNI